MKIYDDAVANERALHLGAVMSEQFEAGIRSMPGTSCAFYLAMFMACRDVAGLQWDLNDPQKPIERTHTETWANICDDNWSRLVIGHKLSCKHTFPPTTKKFGVIYTAYYHHRHLTD